MLSALALAAVAVVAAWGLYQFRVYPTVAAGYRAKAACTALFGSGRSFDAHLTTQVSDDAYLILRPFRIAVDHDLRTVTSSCFGWLPRTAIHRDGLGATLLAGPPAETLGPRPHVRPHAYAAAVWPGRAASAAMDEVVAGAFSEPNPRRRRRTYGVLVVQDGVIVAERYACGITQATPMPGWSMAKSVLNALVGILVADGRLRLDQRELVPEWRGADPRSAISLEDLLRMRSGLRFSEAYGNPWSDVIRMLYRSHDTAAFAASRPLASPPGAVWEYTSGTSNILSRIVRSTVGDEAYHAWPRRVLFDRLGMDSAVLEPDGAGTFICSSYMLATARDWARFGQLFAQDGRHAGQELLPAEWIRFSTTPTPQSPHGRYGAHWWLRLNEDIGGGTVDATRLPADAFFAVGHEGQTLSIVPSKRLVVVRLGASIYIDAWNQARFLADIIDAV